MSCHIDGVQADAVMMEPLTLNQWVGKPGIEPGHRGLVKIAVPSAVLGGSG
jgi:hypothetical protein